MTISPVRTASDNFTDSAISGKYNGQAGEKELQPWEAEGPSEALETLENPAAVSHGSVSIYLLLPSMYKLI